MAEEIGFENGRNSNFQGFVTLTLTLTLDPAIRHTIVHHSSTSTYIPNFIQIEETFCGLTDGRTDGHFSPSNIIRSTFGSRPNKHTRRTDRSEDTQNTEELWDKTEDSLVWSLFVTSRLLLYRVDTAYCLHIVGLQTDITAATTKAELQQLRCALVHWCSDWLGSSVSMFAGAVLCKMWTVLLVAVDMLWDRSWLMNECLQTEPSKRITFKEVVRHLLPSMSAEFQAVSFCCAADWQLEFPLCVWWLHALTHRSSVHLQPPPAPDSDNSCVL